MSEHSKIEWTDATWNPLRGCTKISPGCKHCYAETFAERFRGVKGHPYEQGFDLRFVPEKLSEPFRWSSPKTVFVNSMSDLFQPGVPDAYIEDVVRVMVEANWHTYQVLTKRSERLRDLLSTKLSPLMYRPSLRRGNGAHSMRVIPRPPHRMCSHGQSDKRAHDLGCPRLLHAYGRSSGTGLLRSFKCACGPAVRCSSCSCGDSTSCTDATFRSSILSVLKEGLAEASGPLPRRAIKCVDRNNA
jgi:Protein of unknown function (DUF5131)